MKSLLSPFRTTSPSKSRNPLRCIETRSLCSGTDSLPRLQHDVGFGARFQKDPRGGRRYGLSPPFGTHNAALVGSGAGGLRSKSLQELFGHVGGPVLRIDAEPEGEVGAEDHC